MRRIDLHIHTNKSDGKLTPIEIINEAVRKNIDTISITDHDTVDAYTKEFFEYAEKRKINIVTGVEISTKIDKCGIHVLGYNINIHDINFVNALEKSRNSRHIYLHDVSEKLSQLGYFVDVEKLDRIESVTKDHIAENIVNNEKNREILIEKYKAIPTKGEFIETMMNENCPAYVKKNTLSPKEAADIIRNAGGKVFLAHPVAYVHQDRLTENDILKIVKEMNPDGIEANYIFIDRNNKKINEVEKWNEFAKKNNLLVSVGSDFHKYDENYIDIGFSNMKFIIKESEIDDILKNILN